LSYLPGLLGSGKNCLLLEKEPLGAVRTEYTFAAQHVQFGSRSKGVEMARSRYLKSLATGGAFLGLALAGILGNSHRGNAAADLSESQIQQGLAIAPVQLNLKGKNRSWVAQGSYLVNAVGGCNDCHTNPPYAEGGNPFLGQPKKIDPTKYLGGGAVFIPANALFPGSHPIITRNLTPDHTGLPEGGASFEEFKSIMRTGVDPDHVHPEFGMYLQIMPWPVYQNLTDNDLRSIYEYLSAIPCVEGDPGLNNPRPAPTRCHG